MTSISAFLHSTAVLFLVTFSSMLGACRRSESRPLTFSHLDPQSGHRLVLFYTESAPDAGKCWYLGETLAEVTATEKYVASALSEHAIPQRGLMAILDERARANTIPTALSTVNTVGKCSEALGQASALVSTMLTPGAQAIAVGTVVSSVTKVLECGMVGQKAWKGLWNAYLFNVLEAQVALGNVKDEILSQPLDAVTHMRDAIHSAKRFSLAERCKPQHTYHFR